MALVTTDFNVNITPGAMPPVVHVSEYDIGRSYTVGLIGENDDTFTIPTGTTVTIEGTLNSAVGFSTPATISNNKVAFTLTESMTAYAGKAWCKIKLTLSDEPVQTCAFILAVDRAGVEAETVIGAPGFEEQIQAAVEDYLDQTGLVVDATLSQSGKPADAKAAGDRINALDSAVFGQTETTFVEEVQNTRAYAAGKVNYAASQGETITVSISGSAFTGTNATLYFWYEGSTSHTSVGTINLNTDTEYTLANNVTAVEVYSANGGAGTVRFEISKLSGSGNGLVEQVQNLGTRINDVSSDVSDLANVIGSESTVYTTAHSGGNLTYGLDYSAKQGDVIGIRPYGTVFPRDFCYLYVRYVGDSSNTNLGAIPVGEETRVTLTKNLQHIYLYVADALSGTASVEVHVLGIKDDVDELLASANPLKGKKLNFLGDSITYGSGSSHPFTYYLEQKYGCTCRNYGIAGSTIQYDENRNPMCIRYAEMDDDADIVAVMGGTNDYWNNKPLGTMGDTTNTTFYGALDVLINGMIAKYPAALFYMVTPPHGDNGGNFDGSAKSNSGSMQDIANAVKEVAAKYAVPVLDVFNAGGLYPSISAQKDLFYSDGVHLNTEGQKKLANLHAAFLLTNVRD